MKLYIDTTQSEYIELGIKKSNNFIINEKIITNRNQSELLLSSIDKILETYNLELNDITKIVINNKGGSFTSLRIGVTTANALAFAMNIPIKGSNIKDISKKAGLSQVRPIYNREPNITKSKKRF